MIRRASVLPDRVQSQAGEVIVESSSSNEMSLPATGFGTDGVTATSSGAQGPLGITIGVGVVVALAWRSVDPVDGADAAPVGRGLGRRLGRGRAAATSARPGAAWSGPDEPSLEPPSSLAMPTTSRVAMPSTISRRVQ